MRNRNPFSKGLKADREQVVAVSMLHGDKSPIMCSCCMGTGENQSFMGFKVKCGQCMGIGYDYIGKKTLNTFYEINGELHLYHTRTGQTS